MPEDEVPEFAKDIVEMQKFQRKQYEESLREREENYHADIAAFVRFIEDLNNEQLSYLRSLIEDIGANAYSQQLIGIIMASRTYARGLMVDGKTYEEALGLGAPEEEAPQFQDLVSTVGEPIELGYMEMEVGHGVIAVKEGTAPLKCKACGKPYADLEDFTEWVNKSNGCPGCIHKAKWG